jgi:hypothetical protein
VARKHRKHYHHRRHIRHHSRGATGIGGRIGAWFGRLIKKPISHLLAPAFGISAILTLLLTPRASDGGSWIGGLTTMFIAIKAGNANEAGFAAQWAANALKDQVIQNALPAAGLGILAAITAWFGRVMRI